MYQSPTEVDQNRLTGPPCVLNSNSTEVDLAAYLFIVIPSMVISMCEEIDIFIFQFFQFICNEKRFESCENKLLLIAALFLFICKCILYIISLHDLSSILLVNVTVTETIYSANL